VDDYPEKLAQIADNRQKTDFLNTSAMKLVQDSRRNLPRAIALSEMALELSTSGEFADQPYQGGMLQSLKNLGEFYVKFANYDLALAFLFKALDLLEDIQADSATAEACNWIGVTYGYLGEFGESLNYYLKAAELYENLDRPEDKAGVLNNIAQIYLRTDEPDRALAYLEESQVMLQTIGAVDEQAEVLNSLCRVYARRNEHDLALKVGLRSASLYRQSDNALGQANVLISLGDLYRADRRYTRFSAQTELHADASINQQTQVMDWGIPNNALDCYHASLDIARQIHSKFDMVVALLRLGDTYLVDPIPALDIQDRQQQALGYITLALDSAKEINARQLVYESHRLLSEIYKQMGEFALALEHFEQFHAVRDGVFSRESATRLRNLEIVHQVDAARKQAELSQLKNITLQHEIQERQDAQKQLEEINLQLQDEVNSREQLISDLNAFSHMVAHDLKTPLTSISIAAGLVQMQMNRLVGEHESGSFENVDRIFWLVERMNRIINELLTLASVRDEEVYSIPLNMAQIIEDAERRVAHLALETQAQVKKPASWPVALGHAPWIEEVWSNYLSNAMTYGGAPPRIELGADELEPVFDTATMDSADEEDDLVLPPGMVRFWIRDNGAGISPEFQPNLFQPYHMRNAENGVNPVHGHGLGLSIVKRIIEKLNGHVGIESTGVPGEGSLFYFVLPAAAPRFDDYGV